MWDLEFCRLLEPLLEIGRDHIDFSSKSVRMESVSLSVSAGGCFMDLLVTVGMDFMSPYSAAMTTLGLCQFTVGVFPSFFFFGSVCCSCGLYFSCIPGNVCYGSLLLW